MPVLDYTQEAVQAKVEPGTYILKIVEVGDPKVKRDTFKGETKIVWKIRVGFEVAGDQYGNPAPAAYQGQKFYDDYTIAKAADDEDENNAVWKKARKTGGKLNGTLSHWVKLVCNALSLEEMPVKPWNTDDLIGKTLKAQVTESGEFFDANGEPTGKSSYNHAKNFERAAAPGRARNAAGRSAAAPAPAADNLESM